MKFSQEMERQISSLLLRLGGRSPFFGALALFARVEASDKVPTAATDGRDIFINPAFFGQLSPAEQEGVLLHEVLHAALLHVSRGRGRDGELWNVAADIVVNGILAREGYTLPSPLRDGRLENYSVEEVYDLLSRRPKRRQKLAAEQKDLLEERPGDPGESGTAEGELGESQRVAAEDYWRQAVEQAKVATETTQIGTVPAYLQREVGSLEPSRLNWRHYLWRYLVRTPVDYTGWDRRFVGHGLYLDALEGETVRVFIGVDTSGSIQRRQLEAFLGEVQGILRAYPHLRCDLYFTDKKIHGPFRLLPGGTLPKPVGGGGTDFRPFFEQVNQDYRGGIPSVAVYLTDGYGAFPKSAPPYPVLWVVTPGGLPEARFPFGEAVRQVE